MLLSVLTTLPKEWPHFLGVNTAQRLTALNNLAGVVVLAWRRLDEEGVVIDGNFSEEATAGQLLTLRDLIVATFPNVDNDTLKSAGQDILQAGLTRWQVIQKLITKFKTL